MIDLGALRAITTGQNFALLGSPCTVTPPGGAPIETRCIWITPATVEATGGAFARQIERKSIALPRADVPHVPRGTIIVAPELPGGEPVSWRVDSPDIIEPDNIRVFVTRAPDAQDPQP